MNGFVTALKSELFIALRTFASKLILLAPALVVILQNVLLWITETGQAARDPNCQRQRFRATTPTGH